MGNQIYTEYAEILFKYTKLPMVAIYIGILILVILSIVAIKLKYFKKFLIWIIAGVMIVLFAYYFKVYIYKKDINNNDYIEYTGEFYIEDYYYATKNGLFILIKTPEDEKSIKYKAYGNIDIDINTTYYGTFVIGKNSRALVDLHTEYVIYPK